MALPPRTVSIETASETTAVTTVRILLLFIATALSFSTGYRLPHALTVR
jgi:hypothetical protein